MDSIGSTNGLKVGFWGKMNEEMLEFRYPVHRACRDGDHSALSSMIAHGKHDLYSEDQFYGWSPVHWAAYYGKLECLQILISSGVNGEVATQRFHQSPTHVAAFGSQPHCLMWLLQNGANVNAQDYLGETPTHKAARSGSLECLGILKANGAQFLSQNNNGHVPKDLAISCGNETSARYIMQVQEASAMNGSIHSNGICSRKRGISELSQEEVKKVCADPSMPFAPPIAPTTEESMGTDGDCEMQTEESMLTNTEDIPSNTEDIPSNTDEVPLNTEKKPQSVANTSPPPSIPRDCGQYQRDFWMECYVPHQAPHRCMGLRGHYI